MILQRHARTLIGLAVLLSVLLGALGGMAHAQAETGIDLTARVGLSGYCKEESWVPVRVLVENTGADVTGRVQVSFQNTNTGESVYGQDITLATTSRKEFFLYFYSQGFIRNLKVSLIADGKTLASDDLTLSCLGDEATLIGMLTDDPSNYDQLNEVRSLGGLTRAVPLQIADLPDRLQGWDALDVLVISGVDTSQLTEAQRDSLSAWVSKGGRLLAVGGPKWEATAIGIEDLLPLSVTSTQTMDDLSALPAFVKDPSLLEEESAIAAVGRVREDAHILVEQDGLPLIVEREMGFGKVFYLSVDPTLRPLSSWDAMVDVYSHLLGSDPSRLDWVNGNWDTYAANSAVSTFGNAGVPSSFYICGWLILYVVAIGPVNFLFLRKRREMAWLTIPVVVLVFSALAYFYGFIFRGQKPIVNRITVMQAWDTSAEADVRALVGVYSPSRSRYDLEATDHFMLYPFDWDTGFQAGDDWLMLMDESGTTIPDVRVEIGGLQSVEAQGTLPALPITHDLTVHVNAGDPALNGTITNSSEFILRDAILFTSGEMRRLGDFSPGDMKNIRLSLESDSSGPDFYTLDSWTVLDLNYYVEPDEDEMSRRRHTMEMLLSGTNYYYNSNEGNWGVYLMGWLEEPMLPVGVKDQAFEANDTTLYVVRLTPSFDVAGDAWRLPPSLMAWESSLPGATPYRSIEVPLGGYELHFHPVLPNDFTSVDQLILDINSPTFPNPQDVTVSLWDFEIDQWVQIEDLQWGANHISNPERYLGPGDEVRLKVQGDPNNYMEISPDYITLVVKP